MLFELRSVTLVQRPCASKLCTVPSGIVRRKPSWVTSKRTRPRSVDQYCPSRVFLEKSIQLDPQTNRLDLFGPGDGNLRMLRKRLGVRLAAREDNLLITGDEKDVARATDASPTRFTATTIPTPKRSNSARLRQAPCARWSIPETGSEIPTPTAIVGVVPDPAACATHPTATTTQRLQPVRHG